MSRSIGTEFEAVCRRVAARPAIVDGGMALSYDGLFCWSDAISRRLDSRARLDGRRVALVLPNSAAFVASFFGVVRAGGVVAPLNPGSRLQELEHYLSDVDAAAVMVDTTTADGVREAIKRLHHRPALFLLDGPGSCQMLLTAEATEPSPPVHPQAPPLLLYTSGSTGSPKRVLRSHAQLSGETQTLREIFQVTEEDRFLGAAPFSHTNGLVRTVLTCMLGGATLHPIRQFVRRGVLRLIADHRLTFFGGVPQMFILLARTPARGVVDLSSLRTVFSASAPLMPEDNRAFRRIYGRFVRQLYGSTETGTITYNDNPEPEGSLESVGRPLPGVALSVLGDDGGRLPPGREGEIAVSSPFAVSCYEGDAVATERSFRDGWYLTGDLGRIDREGYAILTGRKGFLINRGGYKVSPEEVEATIRQHPKVRDAAVVGAPGDHGDEIVRCFAVVDTPCSVEEIILHCRSRIADYKIPARIEFVKELPRTPTGKLCRGAL